MKAFSDPSEAIKKQKKKTRTIENWKLNVELRSSHALMIANKKTNDNPTMAENLEFLNDGYNPWDIFDI